MSAAGKQAVQGCPKISVVIEIARFIPSDSLYNKGMNG
jgi:hypothetical protein